MKTKTTTLNFSNEIVWSHLLGMGGALFLFLVVLTAMGNMGNGFSIVTMLVELLVYTILLILLCIYLCLTEYRNTYMVYDNMLFITEYHWPWHPQRMTLPIDAIASVEIKRTWLHPKAYLWITISGEQHVLKAVTHRDDLYHYIQQQIQLSQKS